jgi:hypothetical protein
MREAPRPGARLGIAAVVGLIAVAGVAGGLVRAGVALPIVPGMPEAVSAHAFLMVCAFLGTVIGLERAVALRHPAALPGPLASALAGVAVLMGLSVAAKALALAAALAFGGVNLALIRRQPAAHTALLGVAAVAWGLGCLLHAAGWMPGAVVPLWLAFLVITVAAERLEMTRLLRRRPAAQPLLVGVTAALLAGALLSGVHAAAGGLLYGGALIALALWLAVFDIARRTVRAAGLSRYMAVCLLGGYAWLALAGGAWGAMALGAPTRDAALHALALGFIVSMVFGHAPVILPALARFKLAFGPVFYGPLLLLHATLALRLLGVVEPRLTALGAAGNALALATFALTATGAALAWRRGWAGLPRNSRHDALVHD